MTGWIKLHRDITNHWIWNDKPFDKCRAWIDLILMANHKDNKFVLGNEVINVNRGSFITSEVKLMERWGWSKTKVRAFLNLLEKDSMIVKNSDRKKTTITIVKYNVWQDIETTEEPQKDHKKTTKRLQKDTNKNDKNVKNEKKIYTDFVSMTEEEYQKLVTEHGEILVKRFIETLNNYKGATGKKYKSDYLAIRNWVIDKVTKEKPQQKDNYKMVY
jgi:hypothetical protein